MTPEDTALAERLDMQSMGSPWFGSALGDDMQKAATRIRALAGEVERLDTENDALLLERDSLRCEVAALNGQLTDEEMMRDDTSKALCEEVDETERLRAEVDTQAALITELRGDLLTRVEDAQADLASLRKDAERYRWLRDNITFHDIDHDWPVEAPNVPTLAQVSNRLCYHATDNVTDNTLDAAIDAALADKPLSGPTP